MVWVLAKGAELFDLVAECSLGIEFGDVVVVVVIHGEDEIEVEKILSGELARSTIGRDITIAQRLTHSAIRALAGVPVERASGVDVNLFTESGLLDLMAEDVFSGGRPADISETDKKDVKRRSWHDDFIL